MSLLTRFRQWDPWVLFHLWGRFDLLYLWDPLYPLDQSRQLDPLVLWDPFGLWGRCGLLYRQGGLAALDLGVTGGQTEQDKEKCHRFHLMIPISALPRLAL